MPFYTSRLRKRNGLTKLNLSLTSITLTVALGLGLALPDFASAHEEEESGGIEMEGGMTWILQSSNGASDANGGDGTDLTYTFDLSLSGQVGEHGTAVVAFEGGGGEGIDHRLQSLSTANYDAFVTDLISLNPGTGDVLTDLQALSISQLYYSHSYRDGKIVLDVGKLDVHSYLDQNAYANDETEQFMSGIFTRTAGTGYGEFTHYYAPGVVAIFALGNMFDLTVGAASTGGHVDGGGFNDFGHRSAAATQIDFKPTIAGHEGNYRLYVIRDDRVYIDINGNETANTVWGLSFDQAVANGVGMFARYSNQDGDIEENSIKTTWSVGALIEGGAWSRGDDAIGIGYGSVNVNDKSLEFAGDPNAADETRLEVFYRFTFSDKFALTPDIQVIGNNGGNSTSDTITVYGIRGQVDF